MEWVLLRDRLHDKFFLLHGRSSHRNDEFPLLWSSLHDEEFEWLLLHDDVELMVSPHGSHGSLAFRDDHRVRCVDREWFAL